jgi:ABC-type phosphate transport system substrate-binding protein
MRTVNHLSHVVILAITLVLHNAAWSQADGSGNVFVIVNINSPVTSVTRKEVADIYLGRTKALGAIKQVMMLDQAMASPIRSRFYKNLTGKDVADIDSYWARLLFAGQTAPPLVLPDADSVIATVHKNQSAIGYLDHLPTDKAVRVVLTLEERH